MLRLSLFKHAFEKTKDEMLASTVMLLVLTLILSLVFSDPFNRYPVNY